MPTKVLENPQLDFLVMIMVTEMEEVTMVVEMEEEICRSAKDSPFFPVHISLLQHIL